MEQETILVPLDGSALAETILPYARLWAHATDRTLTLLQVIPAPAVPDPLLGTVAPDTVPYPTWTARHQAAQQYLSALGPRLNEAGHTVHIAIREGDAATMIVAYAAGEAAVAGIALSTHGHGGLDRLLLGSVAEQVLHSAPKPLLVMRPQRDEGAIRLPPARPYRRIVVPLDGSASAEQALTLATPLALATGGRLVLVAAPDGLRLAEDMAAVLVAAGGANPAWFTAPSGEHLAAYLAQREAALQASGVRVETHVIGAPPVEAILQCSAAVDADLIVMATRGRGGLERWWHGSIAQDVVQRALRPVILVRVEQ